LDSTLDTAPVVACHAARDQARLLHPGQQPAHAAFAGLAHPYDRQPEPQSVRKINNLF
jgi:hypothetical protein